MSISFLRKINVLEIQFTIILGEKVSKDIISMICNFIICFVYAYLARNKENLEPVKSVDELTKLIKDKAVIFLIIILLIKHSQIKV
jgi:hypothetical protein